MNSNDALADFNDDEVTSSGKSKVNHLKPWEGSNRDIHERNCREINIDAGTAGVVMCANYLNQWSECS